MEKEKKKVGRPVGQEKHGGRKKGTPNKVTTMSKGVLTDLLTDYKESGLMAKDFMKLEPKDRLGIAEKFMQYILPKVQSIAVDINHSEEGKTIEDRLRELSQREEE